MVAFSMNITLDIVFGAIVKVLVADKVAPLVTLKYMALAGSSVHLQRSLFCLRQNQIQLLLQSSKLLQSRLRLVFVLGSPSSAFVTCGDFF